MQSFIIKTKTRLRIASVAIMSGLASVACAPDQGPASQSPAPGPAPSAPQQRDSKQAKQTETPAPPPPVVAETPAPPPPVVAETPAPPPPVVAETPAPPPLPVAETPAPPPPVVAETPAPPPPVVAETSTATLTEEAEARGEPIIRTPMEQIFSTYLDHNSPTSDITTAAAAVAAEVFNERGAVAPKLWELNKLLQERVTAGPLTATEETRVRVLDAMMAEIAKDRDRPGYWRDAMTIIGTSAVFAAVRGFYAPQLPQMARDAALIARDAPSRAFSALYREASEIAVATSVQSRRTAEWTLEHGARAKAIAERTFRFLSPKEMLERDLRSVGVRATDVRLVSGRVSAESLDIARINRDIAFLPTSRSTLKVAAIRPTGGTPESYAYLVFRMEPSAQRLTLRPSQRPNAVYFKTDRLSEADVTRIMTDLQPKPSGGLIKLVAQDGAQFFTRMSARRFTEPARATLERARNYSQPFDRTDAGRTFFVSTALLSGGYILSQSREPRFEALYMSYLEARDRSELTERASP